MTKPQVLAVQYGDISLLLPFSSFTTMEAIRDDKQTRELSSTRKTIEVDVIGLISIFSKLSQAKVTCPRTNSNRSGGPGFGVLVALCKDGVLLRTFLRSCLLPLEAEVCEVRGKNLVTILACSAIRSVSYMTGLGPGLSLL